MLENDPNIKRFENFRNLFGDAEYLTVGIEARPSDEDLFVADTIKIIHEISEMLEEHPHVTKVSSLSNYQYTHSSNGIIRTEDLFSDPDSIRANNKELLAARQRIRDEELAINSIITEDFLNTRILARTEYIKNENKHKIKIANALYNFIRKQNYAERGYDIRLAGGAIIAERFENLSKRDTYILNPLVASIMCLILYMLYGSILSCLFPWFLIGTSVIILSGLQAVLGFPMTVVNVALIPTVMIIGMGVSIHLLSEFFSLRLNGYTPIESSNLTIKNLLKPIFFTALTTAIGFSALSITKLTPVKHYALLAASGAIIVFIVSVTFFVCVLSFVSYCPKNIHNGILNKLISCVIAKVGYFCYYYRASIAVLTSIFITFCLITVPKISVDSNIYNYFKLNNWVYQDMKYFDKFYKVGGMELVIDSGRIDGIKDPDFLEKVEGLEFFLNGLEQVGKVTSAVNFIKRLRQALNEDDRAFFLLPENSNMTAQLLLMYSNSGPNSDLSDSIDFDHRFLRVSVPVENMSAKKFSDFYKTLRVEIAKTFSNLSIEYTGPLILYNAQETYINSGLKKSFALALVMIGLSFFILFKSLKYGFIALFPSVLPILIVGGSTTLLGLSLDLGTIIVGAMCMGIAVDDSIHVMSRYLNFRREGLNTYQSIDLAIRSSGKAVIFTSLILVFGFSAMLFASLIPTILFGVFAALIMALALLGDIIVLPALLYIFERD